MDIKITIPDNQFEDILKNEINSLTKEQLSEIVQSGIKEYMFSEDGKNLILDKFLTKSGYYSSSSLEPQPWIVNILKESLNASSLPNDLKEVGDLMVSHLKENHKAVIENMFLNIINDSFKHKLFNDIYFQENIKNAVRFVMDENRNK